MKEDLVNHPRHYTSNPSGVENIELVENLSFNLGNAFKYVARHRFKGNPALDIKKAIFYVRRENERLKTQHLGFFIDKSEMFSEEEDRLNDWCLHEDNQTVVDVVQRLWYTRFASRPEEFLEAALGLLEVLLAEFDDEDDN